MINLKNNVKYMIIGAILSIGISGYADDVKDFVLSKVTYPLVVNGQKYQGSLPILNLNNTTYVPLRVAGELLGTKVDWNDSLKQVEISGNNAVDVSGVSGEAVDKKPSGNVNAKDEPNNIITVSPKQIITSSPRNVSPNEPQIYNINNELYIKLGDIEKYNSTKSITFTFSNWDDENRTFNFVYNTDPHHSIEKNIVLKPLIVIPNFSINGISVIKYSEYTDTLLPIIKETLRKLNSKP